MGKWYEVGDAGPHGVYEFARMMQRERALRDARIDRQLAKRTDALGDLYRRGKATGQTK